MKLFEDFSTMNEEKIQLMLKSFFSSFSQKIKEVIDKEQKDYEDINALARALKSADVHVKFKNKLYDTDYVITGYLCDIEIENLQTKYNDERKLELKQVLLLIPDQDGYFHFEGKKLYSPFVVFDKFNMEKSGVESTKARNKVEDEEFDSDEQYTDAVNKSINLSDNIVLQGYYIAFASVLAQLIYDAILDKRTIDDKGLQIRQRLINMLALQYGVLYIRYYNKDGKYIVQKIPNLFMTDELNMLEYLSEPRKVVYPNEKVNIEKRFPHESHIGIVDLLETPESDKIGLTLTLVDSDDLRYDFKNLRIYNQRFKDEKISTEDKLKVFDDSFLSLATKQIPFILHSDAARILMGSKNLKQSLRVIGAEEPILKTGYEKEKLGVNALVAYGLFDGLNFEDGIVVSESFAQKMTVKIVESEKFIVEVVNDKSPKIENGEWVYTGQGKNQKRIKWKVKEGEIVHYGKTLFEVYNGKSKKLERRYTYTGRYIAKVKSLPEIQYPSASVVSSEPIIKFYIEFEVEKPLEVGDKIMGRHGNKGTISAILKDEDMPEVEIKGEKKKLDVILSPLSVVSRMNLGQLYETHFSMAIRNANFDKIKVPISPLANVYPYLNEIKDALKSIGADDYGRFKVTYKGNTWLLTSGYQYIVRLDHCVRDKLHVVSIASESELTNQPKKGRSNNGGQRFGELEFWSLYSYSNRNLIKLLAQKNLSVEDKSEKYNKHLDHYPEERFKQILTQVFGLNLSIKEPSISEFKLISGSTEFTKNYNENDEIFREYILESINSVVKKYKYRNIDLSEIYRLYYMTEIAQKSNILTTINNFLDLLKTELPKIEADESKSDMQNLKKFIDDFKSTEPQAYNFLLTLSSFNEVIEKIYSKTEEQKEKSFNTIKSIVNNLSISLKNFKTNQKIIERKLKDLLMTKDGYLRDIVIARRQHYSARTVISPMPLTRLDEYNIELDLDTVVLPVDFGIEWYTKKLSGLNISKDTIENALKGDLTSRKQIAQQLNKIMEMEDVFVLLNRQPSIHRHSIQSFKPVFWHNYTIGLPINVCEGFNADFDGDTMAVILPREQTEAIKEELRSMLPSRNPFRLGNGELNYSIDQDMVYGYYCKTGKDKKSLKAEIDYQIRQKAHMGKYEEIKEYMKSEIIENYVKTATNVNLTLSVFEILNDAESFQRIKHSKSRGNDKQYKQLNEEIKVEERTYKKGFVHGLEKEEYFHPQRGLVRRARRTLMDKKLKVADAGYFTRWLVEFLGAIQTKKDFHGFVEHKIELSALPKAFGKKRFLYRWIKKDNGELIFALNENDIPEQFILLSPSIIEEENKYIVSSKYCGYDVSRITELRDKEYIGLSAGHVIGERGTQLSMETFHTGGKGLDMAKVRNSIFKAAFETTSYAEFLNLIEEKFKKDMDDETVSLLEYLDIKSIYLELLYNYAQYLKREKKVKSAKQYAVDFDLRGPLTCMTFESGLDVLKNIALNKEYKETHPRVEYSFYWRWM